ncbi:hypothetical protein RhiirC2_763824 [Rhizophagus irregularis]|uniref:Uncharacterized protein n=1 Tax=Rhizophagus irregularis TaxID=588596 RepID=A0A2N1M7R0_9GLOM|nr:hypothetical protein RhiirC2_763824 [Rhizophagus irregularis]
MEALVIDAEAWYEDANTNLRSLKHDVGRCITESTSYEKTMWERIETELEEINVEDLGFDPPICSGVLDIKSKPFTNMPGSVSDIFKEPFQKYKLEQNHDVMEACKEFIQNKESKINVDEVLGNINYSEWLDKPKELQDLTKWILESMLKVWKSPKYEAYIKKGKSINEGSGEEGSSASATRKGSRKIAQRANYMMVAQLGKNAELEIVYLEIGRPNFSQDKWNLTIFTINIAGDVIKLYAMRKNWATIPLHMTSPSAVYLLIHTLLTLKMVVEYTIHKILYSPYFGDSA